MASQFYILCKLFGVSIEGMFAARGTRVPGPLFSRTFKMAGWAMASQFYILCKLFGVSIEGMFAARGGCENPGGARI